MVMASRTSPPAPCKTASGTPAFLAAPPSTLPCGRVGAPGPPGSMCRSVISTATEKTTSLLGTRKAAAVEVADLDIDPSRARAPSVPASRCVGVRAVGDANVPLAVLQGPAHDVRFAVAVEIADVHI